MAEVVERKFVICELTLTTGKTKASWSKRVACGDSARLPLSAEKLQWDVHS
jgi:hypothetical protein